MLVKENLKKGFFYWYTQISFLTWWGFELQGVTQTQDFNINVKIVAITVTVHAQSINEVKTNAR